MKFRPIEYMEWIKTRPRVKYDFCRSGVEDLSLKDLDIDIGDLEIFGENSGYLYVPQLQNYEKNVLIVSNLSDGDHDPDNHDWDPSIYTVGASVISLPDAKVYTDKKNYLIGIQTASI